MVNINRKKILQQTEDFVHRQFETEGSGHDWWHIFRVRNMALKLAEIEGGDTFIIEMAALLHDLDDWKISDNSGSSKTHAWLKETGLLDDEIQYILEIIDEVSFKGAGVETKPTTIEAKIVQDADRLDAIGAIGIARTFAYGGNKGRLIYDPQIQPQLHESFEAYKKTDAPTINHFYEKLLLLKDRINTEAAKRVAVQRHHFMELYLKEFFNEWDLKL